MKKVSHIDIWTYLDVIDDQLQVYSVEAGTAYISLIYPYVVCDDDIQEMIAKKIGCPFGILSLWKDCYLQKHDKKSIHMYINET